MGRSKRSIDMLSGLPDDVLYHILSFLGTKLSMSTSILAKRWRFLWKHVPKLEFDEYHSRDSISNVKGCAYHLEIIKRVIMLHEAKILNTFNLSLYNAIGYAYQVDSLIIYPIQRSVRYLYLNFGYRYTHHPVSTFPRLLLTCKTLVDLNLVSCGVIPSSGELFLPSLKKLNLTYVVYESEKSLPLLLSGCPLLEELTVNDWFRIDRKNLGCMIVSSPTIKTLTVSFSHGGGNDYLEEMLIIDVPALIYLKVIGCDLERAKSLRKTMTCLIEADIASNGDWHMCDLDCNKHGRSIEFISCLSHVKYLTIRSELNDVLIGCGSMKFVNLTKLELYLAFKWYNVVKFLEVADNLEVLIINGFVMGPYTEPKRVPPCMLSRLRTVRVDCFEAFYDDCENIFDMVRYILRNAQVLERMEIDSDDKPSDKGKLLDALRRISLFERGSKSCQVAFNTN